jgi:CO/xanthine dehydrogenase FAD-binding subunit
MLPDFELFEPRDLREAVAILAELGGRARPLAGGTDLLVEMREGRTRPGYLVDIKGLEDLKGVTVSEDGAIVVGALTTLRALERSSIIRERLPILCDTLSQMGSVQIRSRGTIGGNVCNAHASADGTAALLALGARLQLHGPSGSREVAIEEFFSGTHKTVLTAGEVLTHIRLPTTPPGSGAAYAKFTVRNAMDAALVGVGVFLETERDGAVCGTARVSLATTGPKPQRAARAEKTLRGERLSEESFTRAAEAAATEANLASTWRTPEDYARHLIRVVLPEVARQAWKRAGSQGRGSS